ncbi:MAG: hypothetical protein EPO30_11090, partial [Lysobacteraceae bacterium]
MATVPVPEPVYCMVTVVLLVGPAGMEKPWLAVDGEAPLKVSVPVTPEVQGRLQSALPQAVTV